MAKSLQPGAAAPPWEPDQRSLLADLRSRFHANQSSTNLSLASIISFPLSVDQPALSPANAAPSSLSADPVLCDLAERAVRTMVSTQRSRSIACLGEPGSGKTHRAQQLAQVISSGYAPPLAALLRHADALFDAFGCADDGRANPRASRVERVTMMFFRGEVSTAASVSAFALEEHRVVSRPPHERNFNIFYQLLASLTAADLQALRLPSSDPGAYAYARHTLRSAPPAHHSAIASELRTTDSYLSLLPRELLLTCLSLGAADALAYARIAAALTAFGCDAEAQHHVRTILAAILLLGNVDIVAGSDALAELRDRSQLASVAQVLGVPAQGLETALLYRSLAAGHSAVSIKVSPGEAEAWRDALAMALYSTLFEKLLRCANASLMGGKTHVCRDKGETSLTICDFAGLGPPPTPRLGLSQLMLNYAHDSLLAYALDGGLRWEQERYLSEHITWRYVDTGVEPAEARDAVAKSPYGLLPLLEEEACFPRATDHTLYTKICTISSRSVCVRPCKEQPMAFAVNHFGGGVRYEVSGWVAGNRTPLPHDIITRVRASSAVPWLSADFGVDAFERMGFEGRRQRSKTQSRRGRGVRLMCRTGAVKSEMTGGHWLPKAAWGTLSTVFCLRPNRSNQSNYFDDACVAEQLAAMHLADLAHMYARGFPVHIPYAAFAALADCEPNAWEEAARGLLAAAGVDLGGAQFGTQRVFFKSETFYTAAQRERLVALLRVPQDAIVYLPPNC